MRPELFNNMNDPSVVKSSTSSAQPRQAKLRGNSSTSSEARARTNRSAFTRAKPRKSTDASGAMTSKTNNDSSMQAMPHGDGMNSGHEVLWSGELRLECAKSAANNADPAHEDPLDVKAEPGCTCSNADEHMLDRHKPMERGVNLNQVQLCKEIETSKRAKSRAGNSSPALVELRSGEGKPG